MPFGVFDLKIEEIPCAQAIQEASTYKRIDLKRIEPAVRRALEPRVPLQFFEARTSSDGAELLSGKRPPYSRLRLERPI